jgi:hypothetical protein
MIGNTIKKIKIKIRTVSSKTRENNIELLNLLAALQSEISRLAKAEGEHAESIAGFIERSTPEATRREKNPELLRVSLAGLEASVNGSEASHPRLVADSSCIGTVLANMGTSRSVTN